MLTGQIRNQVDTVWTAFWSGGISNPLEVIEQFTYLLYIKGLDEQQNLKERKATRTGRPVEKPVFPEGTDERGRSYADLRWKNLKTMAPAEMFQVMSEHVFPFLLPDSLTSVQKLQQ